MPHKKKLQTVGVVLMTYGSPATLDDIPLYLKNIYGGRDPTPERIAEFKRRYSLIGGSPLIKITRDQAVALEKELNKDHSKTFHVTAGMRFSPPFIADVVADFPRDINKIIGIIMSPQYSPIIMSGYVKQLTEAVQNLNRDDITVSISEDWHLQKYFIKAIAQRVEEALNGLPDDVRNTVPVLFSAHSMPKRVIEKEPNYINHLKETAAAVANEINLPGDRWMFCYQSAGHTPEEWLKPDFADIMPELKTKRHTHVLITPIQFLSDHLEVLYDIEIGAREQAEKYDIQFARTQSLNTSPLFIKALEEVVKNLS